VTDQQHNKQQQAPEAELEPGFDDENPEVSDKPTVAPAFDVATYARETAGEQYDDETDENDRPTLTPPFDMETYAKETMAGADATKSAPHFSEGPISASVASTPQTRRFDELRRRFTSRDFAGALAWAESILADDPAASEARDCAERCRRLLAESHLTQLGPLHRVPAVVMKRDQLRTLSLDHRAGFLLSLVDGVSSFELILDISGMARDDGLRILADLTQQRVIAVRDD
jgi:hypothetical protein